LARGFHVGVDIGKRRCNRNIAARSNGKSAGVVPTLGEAAYHGLMGGLDKGDCKQKPYVLKWILSSHIWQVSWPFSLNNP